VIDLRSLQRALGGEISGNQLLCPGPGHSPRDRSLAVRPSPDGDGFIVHSHCGDDWTLCKDYVRERLGLPQWQPGDDRDRRVDPSRLKTFERAVVEAEAERRPLTQDDRVRIERARAVWDEATDPRGTSAERYLRSRALALDDGSFLAFFEAPDMPFEFKQQHDFDLHIALEVDEPRLEEMLANTHSLTAKYLSGELTIPIPRRSATGRTINQTRRIGKITQRIWRCQRISLLPLE
jgi:hypothetical protein